VRIWRLEPEQRPLLLRGLVEEEGGAVTLTISSIAKVP
jgi:hypothetical protein